MQNMCVVGQGPNRIAWEHGIRAGWQIGCVDVDQAKKFSEKYCARVAITGRIGEKLAALAGAERLQFYRDVARRNLNARWNGKEGKGDKFDREEAKAAVARINAEPFKFYVLLGAEVQRAFGFAGEPLSVRFDKETEKNYLLFPHPSGINAWWNEPFNVHRAKARLREFLEGNNPKTKRPLCQS
jgi:hypothetical protein